jgi:two-component system CheB/CheR fusion protein
LHQSYKANYREGQTVEGEQKIVAQSGELLFPIVGIGASAGGLEAFEAFFRSVSPDSGMAFVLVSHLAPSHESILTEILQRSTSMPVVEVEDQMRVNVNRVYVIPPNRDMAIFHGLMQLTIPEQPRGMRMPIDTFFRSLAEDSGELAIGIILSGTGTDGTQGLRAILGKGGISLVQEPSTAKYDGMPTSAINAGYATRVLPVEKMPETLLSGLNVLRIPPVQPVNEINAMNRILMLLRSVSGHDFSLYKKATITRRIERRMLQHGIGSKDVYARYLKDNKLEITILFKELLINVTSFFRDPQAYELIKLEVLPGLFADKAHDYVFRVWIAGCASGEEAYSIAILLREYMDETHQEYNIQLFATDLDDDAIATARAGVYRAGIAQDVQPARLQRFFIKEDGRYRIKKFIREMVVFAVHNVIKDPPFINLDLLSCRNLLIYMEPVLQSRLINAFYYALKPEGVLLLSPSESIGPHIDLFTPVSRKWKFYRAISGGSRKNANYPEPIRLGDAAARTSSIREMNFSELTRRVLLQIFAPASVVTDDKGNILYIHGDTGKFLRPAPGHATLNVVDMAREGLQVYLHQDIIRAAQNVATLNHEVLIEFNGDAHRVKFSVRPIASQANPGPGALKLLLISFQEATHVPPVRRGKVGSSKRVECRRIDALERELAYARNNLQSIQEDERASGEELKSINEELQSTNEELQSTNEEFVTSQEELRSVNEELSMVNSELQVQIVQYSDVQNDMRNLLDNVNIGTLFLDAHLRIRLYTRDTVRLYCLVVTDIGRLLTDIKSNIDSGDLADDIRAVLETLIPRERQVHTTENKWYLARMQPYRTSDNVISGIVLTFNDISERVAAGQLAGEARELAENIVNMVREPLIVLNADLRVVTASLSYYRNFRTSESETVGRLIYELGNRLWDTPVLRELLEKGLPEHQFVNDLAVQIDFPGTGLRRLLLNSRLIKSSAMILIGMEDIS